MNKVFCFGELLLRMSPGGTWIEQHSMPVYIGGTELNVATALANWEIPVKYCSALPDNYMGKEITDSLARKNIDTSPVRFSGNRIGIYYVPQGADLKNTGVIYDRAGSSFADLSPGIIPWEELFKDCTWFHFSAISPSLNKHSGMVCKEALYYASQKKMTISIDLNFRPNLWQFEKRPWNIMHDLVKYCDVVMGNIWSAAALLGFPVDPEIQKNRDKSACLEHATKTSKMIFDKFPACHTVANTFRFDEGEGIRYYAALNTGEDQFVSPEFAAPTVVDRIGTGDCFMAGLIYGLCNRHPEQTVIDYAAAAAFGKLQERGDTTKQTVDSVNKLLKK